MTKMGRPTDYSQELADTICRRLADGESLRSMCRDDDMPCTSTVCKWLAEKKDFSEQYARAREIQADTLFDEVLAIADDASNDYMIRTGKDNDTPGWVENGETINRTRIRIDARKWMAGKLRPKKYGERIQQDTTIAADDSILALMQRIDGGSRKLPSKD